MSLAPMKFTARNTESLACRGKTETTYFDSSLPGFGLRCRASGVRRWVVQYESVDGGTKRITLGSPAVLTLGQARRIARAHLAKRALGEDPAADKVEARKAARLTLGAVIDQYMAAHQNKLRLLTLRHRRRYLRDWWEPLHRTPISKLTRRDIAPYLNGPPAAAGRARSCLMGCCTWAMEQGYIETNPVIGTGKPDKNIGPRERVLSAAELVKIWLACDGPCAYGTIVRLLIVTGCRRQEVGSMAWSELDREEGTWTIPAVRAKSGRDHTLPLPPLAWKIIDEWQARGAGPERLFSPNGFTTWAVSKRGLDARCGVEAFTLHDIRRSAATHMGDIGISPHTIERVLGHSLGNRVAKTYNHSRYLSDMRVALAQWAERIQELVDGSERKLIAIGER
jgi:integrase